MLRFAPSKPASRSSGWLLCFALTTSVAAGSCSTHGTEETHQSELECELKPSQAFHDRIEPLLADDNVSTCNQCHLSGVNLSAFVRETPCKTLACLVEQGLVDLQVPKESPILGWIERATPDSGLITERVIKAERDAFLEWIQANASCPDACAGVTCGELSQGPKCSSGTEQVESELPAEAVTGCSDTELEQAFYQDVYAWRGRCYPCHFDTEPKADELAPRWLSAAGNCQTGSAASFKRLLTLGLVDTDTPAESLLLTKPLDVSQGGIKHGGGNKFEGVEDPAYVSFLRFVEHYAECRPAQ